MRRLLHISDLHFGRAESAIIESLLVQAHELKPDLIVVSGDITQRARSWQFAQAADFFKRLPTRVLAVPGNHDIPLYHVPMRLFQPLRGYRKYIEAQSEPIYEDDEIVVAGLNTVTRWRWKEGRVRGHQIDRVRQMLRSAPAEVIKVLVMHHPPRAGLWEIEHILGERPDLVLSGHLHKSGAVVHPYGPLLIAAGTAISNRLRGCKNSFNLIEASGMGTDRWIRVGVRDWNGAKFETRSDACYQFHEGKWMLDAADTSLDTHQAASRPPAEFEKRTERPPEPQA